MHVKSFFTIIGQFINVLNYRKNSMHCCSYRPGGYSGFQVTGMIEPFQFQDFFG